jgi:hypothetical protein
MPTICSPLWPYKSNKRKNKAVLRRKRKETILNYIMFILLFRFHSSTSLFILDDSSMHTNLVVTIRYATDYLQDCTELILIQDNKNNISTTLVNRVQDFVFRINNSLTNSLN